MEECKDAKVQAHKCPVCSGNGLVSNGFYHTTIGSGTSTSTAPEQCKSCNGKGYIFSHPKMFSPPYVISKEDGEKLTEILTNGRPVPLLF